MSASFLGTALFFFVLCYLQPHIVTYLECMNLQYSTRVNIDSEIGGVVPA